jgi:hypothetical protein
MGSPSTHVTGAAQPRTDNSRRYFGALQGLTVEPHNVRFRSSLIYGGISET